MTKTLINILGAGRSGTTMLDLMLGNDDNSFSLGEVHAWFRPFRKHHFVIDCNCGDENCTYWGKIKNVKENEFHNEAFGAFEVEFLIDSSKNLPWVMDSTKWAKQNGIQTINFLLYKPIKSYTYSIWKRGESIDAAMERYKTYYNRFLQSGLKAYSLNYDSLVSNPLNTLNDLVKITGQSNTANRANFWEKEHHHLFGSGGTRKQSRNAASEIKSSEEYPPEFESVFKEFEGKIKMDLRLKDIIEKITAMDYTQKESKYNKHYILKPWWYYYLKFKNKIAYYYPSSMTIE